MRRGHQVARFLCVEKAVVNEQGGAEGRKIGRLVVSGQEVGLIHRDTPFLKRVQGPGVGRNRTVDRRRGPQAKPGLEHGRRPSTITRRLQVAPDEYQVQLITVVGPEPGDAGPSGPGRSRHDPNSMELPKVPERSPVDDAAAGVDSRLLPLEPLEMAAKPWLARRQEALDIALRVRPATSGRERDRHDDTAPGINRHPQ